MWEIVAVIILIAFILGYIVWMLKRPELPPVEH